MLTGLAYALLALASGAWIVRMLLGSWYWRHVGLAAAIGLATQSVVQAWLLLFGAPPTVRAIALLALALPTPIGLIGSVTPLLRQAPPGRRLSDGQRWMTRDPRGLYLAARAPIVLASAALLPLGLSELGLRGVEVPLWNFDGAFHVETIDLLRRGDSSSTWYPSGLHGVLSGLLILLPFEDSAAGSLHASWGLMSLGVLAAFEVALGVWRSTWIAAASALLVSMTVLFPYGPHVFSNWPNAAGLVLSLGAWALLTRYVEYQSWRYAVLGGLLGGSVLLVHGIQLYTIAIWAVVEMVRTARRVSWPRLLGDGALALVVAALGAAPYLSTLLVWARRGGAVAAGEAESATFAAGTRMADLSFWLTEQGVANSPLDLLVRVPLFVLGAWWMIRRQRGLRVLCVLVVFAALATAASNPNELPWTRWLYAQTFPWMVRVRLMYVPSLLLNFVEAVGLWWLLGRAGAHAAAASPRATATLRVLGGAALGAAALASVAGVVASLTQWASETSVYTSGDADAMAWLRQHAAPGDRLLNDGAADAGIWAPYKAGIPVVWPRAGSEGDAARTAGQLRGLARGTPAADLACSTGARYLYRGAREFVFDRRRLPPETELANIPGLTRVFASRGASVYRFDVTCPP